MTWRVIVGFLWLTILIAVAGGWNAGGPRRYLHGPSSSTSTAPVLDDTTDFERFRPDAAPEPLLDLYGNEIESAVGDYRIDVRGDIYERHSPETEVTQLAAPSI